MAVVKVFDINGVKTVEPLANVSEQEYDPIPVEEEDVGVQDPEADE